MSNLVQWGSYSLEAAEGDEQELSKGANEFIKWKTGRNLIRPLPVLVDPATGKLRKLMVISYEHYIEVPGAEQGVKAKCPRHMAKQQCPVCELVDQLATSGNPLDAARAKRFAARKRGFMNVIDRADPEAGPKVAAMGKQIMEQIVAIRRDEDAGGDFTDPVNGFDLVVSKNVSKDDQISYKVVPARNATPLGNDEWILAQADLGRYAIPDSAADIMERLEEVQTLLGIGAGGGGGPARRPRAMAPAPAPAAGRAIPGRIASRPMAPAPARPAQSRPRTAADDVMMGTDYQDPNAEDDDVA